MRLAQGQLVGGGHNIYGYDFTKKTPTNPPKLCINPKEARIVKYIFSTYAKGRVGMNQITRRLEKMKIVTKAGKKLWRISLLKKMLKNDAYRGIRYFNMVRRIREYANPLFGIKHSSSKLLKRDRSEWVGVPIPAIISNDLFNKVQDRLAWNRQHYRNPRKIQLLSSLVRCGECGGSYFSYRRYYKKTRMDGTVHTVHRAAYCCNRRLQHLMHAGNSNFQKCNNGQIKAEYLEDCVFGLINKIMIDQDRIRNFMGFFKERGHAAQVKLEKRLKIIEREITSFNEKKKRIIDVYASGDLSKEAYIRRSLGYDNEINELKRKRAELAARIPLVHKAEVINASIAKFCEAAKTRLKECNDFETKRKFLLDHLQKVVYLKTKVVLHGLVPIKDGERGGDAGSIGFKIEGNIKRNLRKEVAF